MAKKVFDETDVKLAQLRKARRLLRRAYRQLETIEAEIVKFRKPRQRKPSDEERAAAHAVYTRIP
jgi:hypothetical protein